MSEPARSSVANVDSRRLNPSSATDEQPQARQTPLHPSRTSTHGGRNRHPGRTKHNLQRRRRFIRRICRLTAAEAAIRDGRIRSGAEPSSATDEPGHARNRHPRRTKHNVQRRRTLVHPSHMSTHGGRNRHPRRTNHGRLIQRPFIRRKCRQTTVEPVIRDGRTRACVKRSSGTDEARGATGTVIRDGRSTTCSVGERSFIRRICRRTTVETVIRDGRIPARNAGTRSSVAYVDERP